LSCSASMTGTFWDIINVKMFLFYHFYSVKCLGGCRILDWKTKIHYLLSSLLFQKRLMLFESLMYIRLLRTSVLELQGTDCIITWESYKWEFSLNNTWISACDTLNRELCHAVPDV
jgi:hypothetical protein